MAFERDLTPFQRDCEASLVDALRRAGFRLTDRSLEGQNEVYVKARVDSTNIWVYIYQDEAGTDKGTLEAPDYSTPRDLQLAFTKWVLERLAQTNAI
jgi:hypothetical protein